MKRSFLLFVLAAITAAPALADESAEAWFRTVYAVQWKETPWNNVDKIAAIYAPSYPVHNSEGGSDIYKPSEQMAANLDEWRQQGWYGSDLAALKVDPLNAGTVIFKAKWHDHFEDAESSFECGWYMIRKTEDSWRITQYAAIDCDAHGL